MEIKFKKLTETAITPTRSDSGAVGFDLYSDSNTFIACDECTMLIDTGIAIEIPKGYWGGIYARSGLACNNGIRLANCVGVIDSSYRGSIRVALYRDKVTFPKQEHKIIPHGTRIAQLIIHK